MPLGDWLKNWSGDQPPEKPENVMVAESLLMELDYHLKEAYERDKTRKQEERRSKSGGVDYSWLMISKDKMYEMPQLERLELEDLCMKVRPDECGRVILMTRDAMQREPEIQEVPRILRAVIHQVLDGRPKDETMPEWIMKSLTNLSKFRPKVSPISIDCDDSSPKLTSSSSLDSFGDQKKMHTIEDLPV